MRIFLLAIFLSVSLSFQLVGAAPQRSEPKPIPSESPPVQGTIAS